MRLFWIVHEVDGARRVMICESGALIFARLEALIARIGGMYVEEHELDEDSARKMIGRTLTASEAARAARADRLTPFSFLIDSESVSGRRVAAIDDKSSARKVTTLPHRRITNRLRRPIE